MLSYQHAYHAGNFADVHKHLWLYATIDHLLRKNSAITFIDTHAGRGSYPLAAEETARLKEYQTGVKRLWDSRTEMCKAGAPEKLMTGASPALAAPATRTDAPISADVARSVFFI